METWQDSTMDNAMGNVTTRERGGNHENAARHRNVKATVQGSSTVESYKSIRALK